MAVRNVNRFHLLWLLAVLSAPVFGALETPVQATGDSQEARHASAPTPSSSLSETAPPKAPIITCAGDQLTISADNSTLSGIFAALRACSGVQVDIPEGAGGSRVFEELGPGPARQVLESLLSGTDFNFVIESSNNNPLKIESVLLMLRPTETAGAHDPGPNRSISVARRAWMQSRQDRSASSPTDESHSAPDDVPPTPEADEAVEAATENAAANPTQPQANDQPSVAAEAPSSSGDKPSPPASTLESTSTPSATVTPVQGTDQKITEMQQMFQQRRQINQNQNQVQGQNPASPQP